ncbi:MAG TPA: hypothetical protein ENI13_00280 [candidate division CPR3 bacterium]|uniref:Uncharacterized protein n=1 Tax=candidate division CPR3 bacterium TaxID=2268181 RepID=A0A7C1T5G9_UNCC3|nr:hypothetical protein [candidate division CPR3 bacterium]
MVKRFVPGKKAKKEIKKIELDKPEPLPDPLTDTRLDRIVPLFVDMIGKLLAAKGMMRYRKDFTERVKEIMEGEDGKEEDR